MRTIASVPSGYYLGAAFTLIGLVGIRAVLTLRRKRGSVRPIGYFSYITHSSLPSVCAACGIEVSDKAKKRCLSNPQRFQGMVYCDRHRRSR